MVSFIYISDKPPQFFSELPSVTEPLIQSNSRLLQCGAQSTPPSLFSWVKDGVYLEPVNSTFSNLRLTNINTNTSGVYQCVASNHLGAIISPRFLFRVACKSQLHSVDKVMSQQSRCSNFGFSVCWALV